MLSIIGLFGIGFVEGGFDVVEGIELAVHHHGIIKTVLVNVDTFHAPSVAVYVIRYVHTTDVFTVHETTTVHIGS